MQFHFPWVVWQLNPQGRYDFAACDVSSMRNVAALARDLTQGSQRLDKINMLVLTPGLLSLKGRTETEEGMRVGSSSHVRTGVFNLLGGGWSHVCRD